MKIPSKISPSVTKPKPGSLSTLAVARADGGTISETVTDWNVPSGMRLHKPGNELMIGNAIYCCESVGESCAKFRNIKNRSDVQNLSNCHDHNAKLNFSGDIVLPEESETKTQNQNSMSKKTKTEENGKPGKIEFIDTLLLAGKHTKAEVADLARKEFAKLTEKTACNTTSWCASTIGTRHKGKVSKHLALVKEAKAAKPAPKAKTKVPTKVKVKTPAKAKAAAPKKSKVPAPPAPVPESAQ